MDHAIFFARGAETHHLASLISVYRGVMLYGDSGSGKSSLINAGLIPRAKQLGFQPERIRVQPRLGEELVIERIAETEDGAHWLPSVLAPEEQSSARIVTAAAAFAESVREACAEHRLLLIFDQFEEIVTLFDAPGGQAAQRELVKLLVDLLREPVPIKVLLAFREDYLGRIKDLLSACPELVDQALRIAPPGEDVLPTIVAGPFESYPGRFDRELSPALVKRLVAALAARFRTGEVSLSEVQTVCLRLWQNPDPEKLLQERGVGGLLEDYLGEELAHLPSELRPAAVALLGQMVTSAGTRNVISADDLEERVWQEGDRIPRTVLDEALGRLSKSRLVRSERRRDLELYEITSEFLVPWISRRRSEFQEERRRAREKRRLHVLWGIIGGLVVVVALVAALAVWALGQRDQARTEATVATSLGLAADADGASTGRPDVALVLALSALAPYHGARNAPVEARGAMLQSLAVVRDNGLLGVLHGSVGQVYGFAFSASGRTIASFAADNTIRRWDLATHREIGKPVAVGTDQIDSVAFSPDGRILALGGDSFLRLWDVASGKQIASLPTSDLVGGLAFTADGQVLVEGDLGGSVVVWDVASRTRVTTLSGDAGINAVAVSPDGRIVAAASYDKKIRLWDTARNASVGSLVAPGSVVTLTSGPRGHVIAAGTDNGKVQVWSLDGSPLSSQVLTGCGQGVSSIAFNGDGTRVAGGCGDGAVRVWGLGPASAGVAVRLAHGSQVTSLAFSNDGQTLASGSTDATIRLWDVGRSAPGAPVTLHSAMLSHLQNYPDTLEASGGELWALGSGGTASMPPGIPSGAGLALSPDGRTLAADTDAATELWDIQKGKRIARLPDDPNSFAINVQFSQDGRLLAVAYYDGRIRFWDVSKGKFIGKALAGRHGGSFQALAFAPRGGILASSDSSGRVQLWSMRRDRPLGKPMGGQTTPVSGMAFSADGRTLASAQGDTIEFWRVADGKPLGSSIVGGNVAVTSLAFSRDGSTLASGLDNGGVRIWDTATFKQLAALSTGDGSPVETVAFWPDRRSVIAATSGGYVRLWRELFWANFGQLSSQVCQLVGGGLDHAEWNLYAPHIHYEHPCA